ncbi:MAG: hypothetical protein CSA50_00590 [Gammaproteobacteria bacterium]|nr:MAG: hypothetical protein CSA50_00590 [Gammaproteobacteria bacterium]
MSNSGLPESVDPIKFAEQNIELEGVIPFARFTRLAGLIRSNQSDATVWLLFGKDEQGRIFVTGSVQVDLILECQRCLGDLSYKLKAEIGLAIVFSDDNAKNLPREYDPYLVDGYDLNIAEMVEEEILLALPTFAYHEPGECSVDYKADDEDDRSSDQLAEKSNPFNVLSELKVKK